MKTFKSVMDHCLQVQMNPKKAAKLLQQNGFDMDAEAFKMCKQKHLARKQTRPVPSESFNRIEGRLFGYKYRKSAAAAKDKTDRIRADLLRGARVARQLGLTVRKSEFDGRVSSYYVFDENNRKYRISDHDIPSTPARESASDLSFYGGADIYASDSPIRRKEWWIRAYALLLAGRLVPQ